MNHGASPAQLGLTHERLEVPDGAVHRVPERELQGGRVDRRHAADRGHRGGAPHRELDGRDVAVQERPERGAEDPAHLLQGQGHLHPRPGPPGPGPVRRAAGLHRPQRLRRQEALHAQVHLRSQLHRRLLGSDRVRLLRPPR